MMRRILFCCLIVLLAACSSRRDGDKKSKTDWRVKMEKEKDPYDLSIFNSTFGLYFRQAKFEVLNKDFRFTSIDEQMRYHPDSPALLALQGMSFFLNQDEWTSLVKFVRAGNELVLFSSRYDELLQKSLHFRKMGGGELRPLGVFDDGSSNKGALRLEADTSKHYGYYGHSIDGFFGISKKTSGDKKADVDDESYSSSSSSSDSYDDMDVDEIKDLDTIPEVLGRSKSGPNFIRYRLGRGHITLHAAPLALSNYFLLQPGNRAYLDGIWHTLPANIGTVYGDNYINRRAEKSNLGVLLGYPPIAKAFWILLSLLILYVLFSLKPLQRRIAIVKPLQNESVSFVETIGRLYFNKGRHLNLADKMIQHFLDWVRNNYYLNTSQLNDAFAESLSAKSGKSRAEVGDLLRMINIVRGGVEIDGIYLHNLYTTIQSYYKK